MMPHVPRPDENLRLRRVNNLPSPWNIVSETFIGTRLIMLLRFFIFLALFAAFPAAAQSGEWKQLFDGKDLVGWKHVGPGEMTVEDGLIRTQGGMGLLYWTGGKLGDCVIRVVFKMRDHNDNSGVFIRIPIEPREEWMPVHYGC